MSVHDHPAGLVAPQPVPARNPPAPPPGASGAARDRGPRTAGLGALAAAVAGAGWIAVGAAGDPPWLELPASTGWLAGPLHGIAAALGPLATARLSVALLVLVGAYALALACARSISLRLALAAVALANLAFTLGPTIVSSDVFGYVAYARELARHGLNPYVSPPAGLGHDAVLGLVYWKHETSPYGPLFTLLGAPLGWLSPAAAVFAFKALAGLAAVAVAWLVAGIAPRRGLDPVRAAIFVGLNPVILFYGVSGAHNDLLASALVAGALGLVLSRQFPRSGPDAGASGPGDPAAGGARGPVAGGAALAVAAAAIKLTLGAALPFVLLMAHRRRRGRSALLGAGLALLVIGVPSLALFGTHLFDQLARISSQARFDIAWSGPDRLAALLGTPITPALRGGGALAAGAVLAAMVIRVWRGADPVAAAGWALLALLASIASLAPWYLAWVLPFAALGHSRALRLVTLAAGAYLLAVHLPALGGHPWLAGP